VVKSIALTSPCSRIAAGGSYVAASASSTGSVYIYSLPDLVFVTELNENTSVVRDIKISSDNSLVFSTADSNIFIYTAGTDAATWLKKASFPCPHVAERFDISSDGAYVRIMGASQELSVLSIGGETVGAPLTVPETLKGLSFASSSVLYSWDTKGVFNHFPTIGQELTKIPTSDRSNALFLTGHDDGSLVLTRLPAFEYLPNENQTRPSLTRVLAHDGSLSSLSFIEEGAKLVTAGSADGLIIVWKVTYDAEEAEIEPVPAEVRLISYNYEYLTLIFLYMISFIIYLFIYLC
jgi:WD40 repeat protein